MVDNWMNRRPTNEGLVGAVVTGGVIGAISGGYATGIEFPIPIGNKFRIALFGNRTGNSFGRWPHYHRSGPTNPKTGQVIAGQTYTTGIARGRYTKMIHHFGIGGEIVQSLFNIQRDMTMDKLVVAVERFGDIAMFESMNRAAKYIEHYDVLNNEYVIYDRQGHLLIPEVTGRYEVVIRESSPRINKAPELRKALIGYIRALRKLHIPHNRLMIMSLDELIEIAVKFALEPYVDHTPLILGWPQICRAKRWICQRLSLGLSTRKRS
ncbi:MAG: hypothetical protein F6K39_42590 [Okeania sp. SIO3B3]|nr:hypothetical protein [Okeania sp. SIO3B3]